MKNYTFLIIATAFLFTSNVNAQSELTGEVVSAKLIAPLVIASVGDPMNFGELVLVTTLADVLITIDPDETDVANVVSSATAAVLPVSNKGRRGQYSVTGEANLLFNITVSNAVSLAGPGDAIPLSAFTFSPHTDAGLVDSGSTDNGTSYYCVASGVAGNFFVGASITIGTGQLPGSYVGSYDITVAYQ